MTGPYDFGVYDPGEEHGVATVTLPPSLNGHSPQADLPPVRTVAEQQAMYRSRGWAPLDEILQNAPGGREVYQVHGLSADVLYQTVDNEYFTTKEYGPYGWYRWHNTAKVKAELDANADKIETQAVTKQKNKLRIDRLAKIALDREEKEDASSSHGRTTVDGGDWIRSEPETIPALWGDDDQILWSEGEGFMIASQQGLGKTTIAQQLILHRLGYRKGKLLGLTVKQDVRPVHYLAMDRSRQAARSMRRMGLLDSQLTDLNLVLKVWKGPLPINILVSPTEFADWVEREVPGCGLVVVDSVKDLAVGLTKDEVAAAINISWQELIARGIDLLLLHHDRKAGAGQRREHTLDDVYGSTWLTSGLGSVVELEGEPGDPTVWVHHIKQPAEPVGPLRIRHNHSSGTTVLRSVEDDALTLAADRGTDGSFTEAEAAQIIFGRNGAAERKRIKRALEKMDQSLVTKLPRNGVTEPNQYRITDFAAFARSFRGDDNS